MDELPPVRIGTSGTESWMRDSEALSSVVSRYSPGAKRGLSRVVRTVASQVPMKRFGTGEEIAEAVLYLCSPAAGFTVGADLVVDGGMIL